MSLLLRSKKMSQRAHNTWMDKYALRGRIMTMTIEQYARQVRMKMGLRLQ